MLNRKEFLFGAAALPMLSRQGGSRSKAWNPAALDAAIDHAVATGRVVGTVVLVSRDGELVHRRAAGYADREAGLAMDQKAVFRLASITKPYIAVTAMRLVERGVLDLDAPVTTYLPSFRPRLASGAEPTITLSQLLSHSAGLSYRFIEPSGSEYDQLGVTTGLDQPGLSLEAAMEQLSRAKLVYAPGASWRYSMAMDVVGAAIAAVSGKALGEVFADEVSRPLGLVGTGFAPPADRPLATPYVSTGGAPFRMTEGIAAPFGESKVIFSPSRALDPQSFQSGGAGMVGQAGDFMKFLEVVRTGGGQLLRSDSVAAMMRDRVGSEAATQGPGWGFGYGWALLSRAELAATPQAAGSFQWGGAYGHNWFVDPARKLTVVAFTNTAFEGMTGAYVREVRDAVYASLA